MKKILGILLITLFSFTTLSAQNLPENLAGIKPVKTTGPNADKLFKDLDNTYNKYYKIWREYEEQYLNSGNISATIIKKDIILGKVSQIRQNTQNSIDALTPFKPIPVLGTAANGAQLALKTTASKMDNVKGKIENVNSALNPVAQRSDNLKNSILGSSQEIYNTLLLLKMIKERATDRCNCIAEGTNNSTKTAFEMGAANVSKFLAENDNSFEDQKNQTSKIIALSNTFNKANPLLDKTINSLDNFMSKFKGSRKAVGEVNKVLDKRFKKKVLGKQISISVRDVLTGGGALKKAKKLLKKVGVDVEKWARKALKPVTNKLGEKLPNIPNLDQYYTKINELKNSVDEFKKISDVFDSYKTTSGDYNKKLENITEANVLNVMCTNKNHKSITQQKASGFVNIKNRWKKTSINVEKGLASGKIAPGWFSAMWVIEPVEGTPYVEIKNRWKNTYLHVEHGKLECTKRSKGWHSSQWEIVRIPGTDYVNIVNRWKKTAIHVEGGKLQCSTIAPGWHSAMWQIHEPSENI